MKIETLQHRIDYCAGAEDMVAIAREYLAGTVLRDAVAAEAWLMRAIDAADPEWSVRAMGILSREILGVEPLDEKTAAELARRREAAAGEEQKELDALLELAPPTPRER